MNIKTREERVRRVLKNLNHRLHKVPAKHFERKYFGIGYQVTDGRRFVVLGCSSRQYEATLDECEAYAEGLRHYCKPTEKHFDLQRQG